MLFYRELEPPTAVLSAFAVPAGSSGTAAAANAAEPAAARAAAPPQSLLLHRLDRLTECALSPDGLDLQRDWKLPEPAGAVVPLPGGRVLSVGLASGTASVLQLPSSQPQPAHHRADAVSLLPSTSYAPVVAELPLKPPAGGVVQEGAAREALAFGGCACSPPLTLRLVGQAGASSSLGSAPDAVERTYAVASRAHGVFQLITWSTGGDNGNGSSPGCSNEGRLEAVAFRATPALLTGGLPGDLAARGRWWGVG
jgi:hypothetical protein